MIFEHHLPTRIHFGAGSRREIARLTVGIGERALIVSGRTAMRRHGIIDRLIAALVAEGVAVAVFDDVSPDPRATEVDRAVALAQDEACDVVLGLGGGSAIDAAKAVSAGMRHGPVGPLVGVTLPHQGDLPPVIAVPTTGGSGAEVTKGAIITDGARRVKAGIRGEDLFPAIAVVDPDLLATVPAPVARDAAFDALAHAIEGYLARKATPVSDLICERALTVLARTLPGIASGQGGPDLREAQALAALLGGMSVATASTCLPHRLQQAMGVLPDLHISHGRGLAAVYPAWLALQAERVASPRLEVISALLGGGLVLQERVAAVRAAFGMTAGLASFGVRPGDVDTLVGAVTGDLSNDPLPDVDPSLAHDVFMASR